MNEAMILELGRRTLTVTATMGGPLLLVGMTVGLLMSVIQTITSLQEQTLSMVPKLAAVALTALLLLPWLLGNICGFATSLLGNLGQFAK
jgi:flagellar biosynthesis protein FliQ